MSDDTFKPSIKLLVVEDALAIRSSMSAVLTYLGYIVQTATDGFEALAAIGMDSPNILLSDLDMPGMSGFELLSVVRQRYPSIQVIAMSGSFSGDEVPSSAIADAFYQKGCGIRSLLRIIESTGQHRPRQGSRPAAKSPIWVQQNGLDSSGRPYVTISCPECLQSFNEIIGGSLTPIREARCSYCQQSIYYAIVNPVEWEPPNASMIASREVRRSKPARPQC